MRATLLIAALAVTLGGAMSAGQTAPTAPAQAAGTAAISGTVRSGATGRPLPNVVVALRMVYTGAPQLLARILRQLTDAQGRFVFRNLPAGEGYAISTTRVGYVDGAYGQSAMFGPDGRISLVAGQWFNQANVLMWKPGAISGRVVDEHGDPLVAAYVRVLAQQLISGQPRLIAGPVARTDDRGEYRIAGLPPGRYLVQMPSIQNTMPADAPPGQAPLDPSEALTRQLIFSAGLPPASRTDAALDLDPSNRLVVGNYATPPAPVNGRTQAYPTTFAPGATSPAGAATIELGLSEERRSVDVAVQAVLTARISGTVDGPSEALAGLLLRLMPAGFEDLVNGGEVATTVIGADGKFMFLNVPAGTYAIDASRTTTEFTFQAGGSMSSLPQAPGLRNGGSQSGSINSAPPGTGYISRSSTGPDLYWTRTPVSVDATDVSNVVVTLQRCVSLSGRFVFEGTTSVTMTVMPGRGGAAPAGVAPVQTTTAAPTMMPFVYLEPANGDPTLGRPRSNPRPDDVGAEFFIDGLKPGPYMLRVPGRVGLFTIKSLTIHDEDFTNKPIEATAGRNLTDAVLTFTDKVTAISGLVRGDQDVVPQAAVIAFPVEREQWTRYGFTPLRIAATPVAGTTGYQIDGLPAGEYYVIAIEPAQITAWQDPAFLERAVPAATRISLDWGERKPLDLKLARVR